MKTEIIGIGIIGTGFARTTQLPAFRACEGARVVAIASGHRENAERAAREFDIPVVASDRPWNWWSDERAGGGALGAIGSHAVDALRWLLFTGVSHVSASLAAHVRERVDPSTGEARAVTSDDEASLLLNFDDGAVTEKA